VGKRGRDGKKVAGGEQKEPEPWKVEEFKNARGDLAVTTFAATLSQRDREEAAALVRALGERGAELGMPNAKNLGGGLHELRGTQIRIFYRFRGRRIVVLDGIVKKRMDIPAEVLKRVRRRMNDVE
jgi:hypothetical protein